MPVFEDFSRLQEFLQPLTPAQLPCFYLITAKDEEDRKKAVNDLIHFFFPSRKKKQHHLTLIDGQKSGSTDLIDALYSRSLFVKTQLILVEKAEKLDKSLHPSIEAFFASPPPQVYLILTSSSWSKNQNFHKKIVEKQIYLDIPELKTWEKEKKMVDWVAQQMALSKKSISFDLCKTFIKRIGTEQQIVQQELEKLLCYCYHSYSITLEDILKICSKSAFSSIWELGEAIFRRDAVSALKIGKGLLEDGEALLPIFRQIRSQLETDYEVAIMLNKGKDPSEISHVFPFMKGQLLARHIKQAQQYGIEAFEKGILAIDQMEMRSKNGEIEENLLLELLILQLTKKS